MARGYSDYGNVVGAVAAKTLDLNQVVTALLGVTPTDGKGRLIWYDTFHSSMGAWTMTGYGDGAVGVIQQAYAEVPPSSALLDCGTLAGDGISKIDRKVHMPNPGKAGIEVSFLYLTASAEVKVLMIYTDGTTGYHLQLMILPGTGEIQIHTGGDYLTIGNIGFTGGMGAWVTVKAVGDFTSHKFVRLIVGSQEFDISAYDMDTAIYTEANTLHVAISGFAWGTLTKSLYLGHVFVTVDEP